MPFELQPHMVSGGTISKSAQDGYTLTLPPVSANKYGLAQVDDYMHLPRRKFSHQPPLRLTLEARVSAPDLPGTWGFGLWNDPFSFGFGGGGMARLLPVLPNAAWFFSASSHNHLSLRGGLPSTGFHVKTFQSPRLPSILSVPVFPALPFLAWPAFAQIFRKLAQTLVKEDAIPVTASVDSWHSYTIQWVENRVTFGVDNTIVLETPITPHGPLGLVIWIDNQYFNFSPGGNFKFGYLETSQEAKLQVRNLAVDPL